MILKVIKLTDVSLEKTAPAFGLSLPKAAVFPVQGKTLSLFGPSDCLGGQLIISKL